jgi:osmotically-inducible protein OsmY
MDYRNDYERGRRYRDEHDFRVSDRRGRDRRDWDRRDYDRGRADEPSFLERFFEDLRSWFRDTDARHREREDREAERRWGGGERGWGDRPDEEVDRGWARQWGYVDRDDARERTSGASRSGGSSWTRERGYVDEGYANERDAGERYYEPRWGWGDPSAWGAERGYQRARGGAGAGPHAGRGPRGYQRSDERIREDVCDALCEHGYIDASDIEVTVLNGEVTLIGVVQERPQKRMAEDAAEDVSGVREVHNQLRVSPGGSGQDREVRPGDPRFRVA